MSDFVRTRIGVATYLAPGGPLAEEELERLREVTGDCLEGGEVNLVLDLEKTHSLTSLALETFLDLQDMLAARGGRFQVVNANALLKEIFTLTGFDRFVEVLDTTPGRRG